MERGAILAGATLVSGWLMMMTEDTLLSRLVPPGVRGLGSQPLIIVGAALMLFGCLLAGTVVARSFPESA